MEIDRELKKLDDIYGSHCVNEARKLRRIKARKSLKRKGARPFSFGIKTISDPDSEDNQDRKFTREKPIHANMKTANKLVRDVLRSQRIKIKKTSRKKDKDGLIYRYYITIGGKRLVAKLVLMFSTMQTSLVIWEQGEQELVDVIFIGSLDDKNRLLSIGKSRIKALAS